MTFDATVVSLKSRKPFIDAYPFPIVCLSNLNHRTLQHANLRLAMRLTTSITKGEKENVRESLRNVWSACSRVDKATSGALNVESEKEFDLEATQLILR